MNSTLQKAQDNEHITLPVAAAALVTLLASLVHLDPEQQGSITTLLVAGASYLAQKRK